MELTPQNPSADSISLYNPYRLYEPALKVDNPKITFPINLNNLKLNR